MADFDAPGNLVTILVNPAKMGQIHSAGLGYLSRDRPGKSSQNRGEYAGVVKERSRLEIVYPALGIKLINCIDLRQPQFRKKIPDQQMAVSLED